MCATSRGAPVRIPCNTEAADDEVEVLDVVESTIAVAEDIVIVPSFSHCRSMDDLKFLAPFELCEIASMGHEFVDDSLCQKHLAHSQLQSLRP